MKISSQCFPTALVCVLLGAPLLAEDKTAAKPEDAAGAEGLLLFEQTILPALTENCFSCHSKAEEATEGGLELDSPSGLRRGGDNGPIFESHQAKGSTLLQMLRHEDDVSAMPPEEKLSDEIIAAFEKWIELGAPDSREDSGITAKEKRLKEARNHWAFQPPQVTGLPPVKDTAWARDKMIDTFVLAAIEGKGMKPVADANKLTLIRRLSFDLIGLPPTTEEIDAYVADDSATATETLVDRLLNAPQFGERWGRHWLDVVRFAESSGMEFNFTYPHAWPFRDYVYDSFNADKPFDQFLNEQVAGDLLSAPEGETAAQEEDRRIAPSILAFGPKRHNASGIPLRMDIVDDQIDVVFRSAMGLTVACARCHDHKFDPIPTKDYYSLAGIFLSTKPMFGTIKQKYSNNPTELLAMGENGQARHEAANAYDKKVGEAKVPLAAKQAELKKATEAETKATKEKTDVEELIAAITNRQEAAEGDAKNAEDKSRTEAEAKLTSATETLTKASTLVADLKKEVATLSAAVATLKKNHPGRPHYAMTVEDRDKPADIKVAIRGELRNRGDVAPRGFLSAVNVPDVAPVNPKASGRLELAEWITNPDNPLTARVMVNRIWHHLFGRGIVPTVDNFGLIGKPPSHPELLDMLALRFVDDGWSVKRMIRAVVLSRAYQLSSAIDENNLAVDPDNRSFWRASPRRLEAEAIRDAILAVSGELKLDRLEASSVKSLGDKLVRGIPQDKLQPASSHRSAYLPVVRDYVPEIFDLFDFPSPSLVSGQRAVTNVPSQALYLRNSKFVAAQSKVAATRLLASAEATDDAQRINLATRWTLGRNASDAERDAALQMIDKIRKEETAPPENTEAKNGAPSAEDAKVTKAWSAWFLTLYTTAEFRYLSDIET